MLSKADFRRLVLNLLDDPNGISKEAYNLLVVEMEERGCQDIAKEIANTDTNDRVFIYEDYAEAELAKMDSGVEIEDDPLPPPDDIP